MAGTEVTWVTVTLFPALAGGVARRGRAGVPRAPLSAVGWALRAGRCRLPLAPRGPAAPAHLSPTGHRPGGCHVTHVPGDLGSRGEHQLSWLQSVFFLQLVLAVEYPCQWVLAGSSLFQLFCVNVTNQMCFLCFIMLLRAAALSLICRCFSLPHDQR